MPKETSKAVEAAKPTIWIATTVILAVALVAFVAGSGITGNFLVNNDGTAVANKAIAFINKNLLSGNTTAHLINVTEKNGLWFMTFDIGGQKYTAYLTKDGSTLFPQGIELKEEPTGETGEFDAPDADRPTAQLFVMSFCPYGIAAEKAMLPVVDLLGDAASIEPHFIVQVMNKTEAEAMLSQINSRGSSYTLADKFYVLGDVYILSLHGPKEAAEDARQAVIFKEYGSSTFWKYVSYVNSNCSLSTIDTCWKTAANAIGLNISEIEANVNTEGHILLFGDQLLAESYDVRGSPTLIINGAEYTGERTPEGYKAGICSGFKTQPAACKQELSNTATAPSGGCSG
ncbi:MAG: hypothetical protein QW751_00470 [Candidatus Aenigmatarchaeota archaeon]|nr:hypothetical protein [Candidatus Aenigmarchaeota archaeon]